MHILRTPYQVYFEPDQGWFYQLKSHAMIGPFDSEDQAEYDSATAEAMEY